MVNVAAEFITPVDTSVDAPGDAQKPRLKAGQEFVKGFKPPNYLVDLILQRGYLYTCTGKTGHFKTGWAVLVACCIAAGIKLGERECRQGTVCFFAGENADDVRARLIATLDYLGLDIENLPIHFFDQIFDIKENAEHIARQVERIGGAACIIVDSYAAFFRGDDENSNTEAGRYTRELRGLCDLQGKPTVLALAHPTKNATRENLLPRGGGAVVAEVDGNLRLWSDDFQTTELHWCGKLRGPDFEPETYQIKPYTCDALTNENGSYPTVVAVPMTQDDIEQVAKQVLSNEDALLDMMFNWPNGSIRTWCESLGWIGRTGNPLVSKAQRALEKLKQEGFVVKKRSKWKLTNTGHKEAQDVIERGAA